MNDSPEPDLLGRLNPIGDTAAGGHVSAGTHRLLREHVTSGELEEDRQSSLPRRPSSTSGWWRWRPRRSRRLVTLVAVVALVAALIVMLPGLLSNDGSVTQPQSAQAQILHRISAALSRGPRTVLIQRTRTESLTRSAHQPARVVFGPVSSLSVDQSSADGSVQRSFSTSSDLRPGFEQMSAADTLQIYDPRDHTIYATTIAGWQAAVQRKLDVHGNAGGSTSSFSISGRDSTGPGPLSVFSQRLRQHLYRIAGRTTIDHRAALKLSPLRTTIPVPSTGDGTAREYLGTVYVSPRTYYPIREVTEVPSAGSPLGQPRGTTAFIITDWSEYKVVPATTTDTRLTSLTARHPRAKIVHDANAYLRVEGIASHPSAAGSHTTARSARRAGGSIPMNARGALDGHLQLPALSPADLRAH